MAKKVFQVSEDKIVGVVIDIESTGLSVAKGDEMTNVAIVYFAEDLSIVKVSDYWMKQMNKITPTSLTNKLGLTNVEVHVRAESMTFLDHAQEMFEELNEVIMNYDVVIQNAQFDATFIRESFHQIGMALPLHANKCKDFRDIYSKFEAGSRALDDIMSVLDLDPDNVIEYLELLDVPEYSRHTGVYDCVAVLMAMSELCTNEKREPSYGFLK